MARIEMSCEGNTSEYSVGDSIIIGRGESCGIKVPSPKASREHCRIFRGTGGFFLEDMGSANGTVLNGVLIGRKLLKHNDEIVVGRVKLRFIDKTEDFLVGKRLGRYQIVEKIGGGAEGIIYRGRQVALNNDVAIKVLTPDLVRQKGGIDKIRVCLEKSLTFSHPNVVKIYEFIEDKGRCFYSMELICGENLLDKTIRKKRLKVADTIEYGLSISSALGALHSIGVLHGDIKPQNILVDSEGNLKLIDLGWIGIEGEPLVEKSIHEEDTEADTEEASHDDKMVFATPQYVAPELINRKPRRESSDIYALSVTLYQLLTGELPFKAERLEELLKQHVIGDVKNPCEINTRIPKELGELVLRGMEIDLEKRVKSAQEYYEELLEISNQHKKKREKDKERVIKRIRNKKYGPIKIGATYKLLGLLMLVLLVGSYGVREYKKYIIKKEQRVEEELALGLELYKSGDYEKSESVLRGLLEDGASNRITVEATKILALLELSDAIRELQALKKQFESGEVAKSKVVDTLRAKLISRTLRPEEELEYTAYLKSIGGDSDIRYEWQKSIDNALAQKNLLDAYDEISKVDISAADVYEREIAREYSLKVSKGLDAIIGKEYGQAGEMLKEGDFVQASKMLNSIVNKYPASLGWRSRILGYFAESNEDVATQLIGCFTSSLDEVAKHDEVGIKEVLFQFDGFMSKQVSEIDTERVQKLPRYVDIFYKSFLKRIKKANSSDSAKDNVVEASIEGKNEFVELDLEGDKLVAYAQDSKLVIDMFDIAPSSIEKLLPVFEISAEEALGAGIYFLARGSESVGKGYLESVLGSGNSELASIATKYLGFLDGLVELPIQKNARDGGIISGSSFKLGGSSMSFPVREGEYRFARVEGGELVLRLDEANLSAIVSEDGNEELLGTAVIMMQEGGSIEVKGYWDKLLVSQNEVVVGQVEKEAIGGDIVAPIMDKNTVDLKIIKSIPVKKREEIKSEGNEEVLG